MSARAGKVETGSFELLTLAVARGERMVDSNEPKIRVERRDGNAPSETAIRFTSPEAEAKMLSARNPDMLRLIATRDPRSASALASVTHRAPQNQQRTLRRLSEAGIVRLSPGEGRAGRPTVAARKVDVEMDLVLAI